MSSVPQFLLLKPFSFERTGHLFCRMSHSLGFSYVLLLLNCVYAFWAETLRSDAMFSSIHGQEAHNVYLSHEDTVFPFVVNQCLIGRYFEALQVSCHSNFHHG